LTGTDAVPAVARAYKAAGVPSIVVGDPITEKDLLEHTMEPRFLGVKALVKSFARIHETNLKKTRSFRIDVCN
jgi:aconitate hydratase